MPEEILTSMVIQTDKDGNETFVNKRTEPIAANIYDKSPYKSMNKLKTEFLRIAAPLLGCGYDDLYNRERKRKLRRRVITFASVFSLVSLFSVSSTYALLQITELNSELEITNNDIIESNKQLEKKTQEAEANLLQAQQNLDYANKQEAEAKKQETLAIKKANEAETERAAAERERQKAEAARIEAEKSRAEAQKAEQEALEALELVKKKNDELLLKTAESVTDNAQNIMNINNDRTEAIKTAISVLPYEEHPDVILPSTQRLLSNMLYNYTVFDCPRLDRLLKTEGRIQHFSFSDDNRSVMAFDDTNCVYVWDTVSNELLLKKNVWYLVNADFCGNESIVFTSFEGCEKYNFKS